jgi:hypothetical protein
MTKVNPSPHAMNTPVEEGSNNSFPVMPSVGVDELCKYAGALLLEIDEGRLSSDAWAILDSKTERARFLIYGAASLRHCARLLEELTIAAQCGLELVLRIVGRAHTEAFLFALYLHFGEYEAFDRIASSTSDSNEKLRSELSKWRDQQRRAISRAKKSVRKVEDINRGIVRWNEDNPEATPKPFVELPHVPRQQGSDPRTIPVDPYLASLTPRTLTVEQVCGKLTRMARDQGFGRESFAPVYHVYRILPAVGTHPTLHVTSGYLRREVDGGFIRTEAETEPSSSAPQTMVNAIYSTAFLSEWVLSSAGCNTTLSKGLREGLEPRVGDARGWTPNTK